MKKLFYFPCFFLLLSACGSSLEDINLNYRKDLNTALMNEMLFEGSHVEFEIKMDRWPDPYLSEKTRALDRIKSTYEKVINDLSNLSLIDSLEQNMMKTICDQYTFKKFIVSFQPRFSLDYANPTDTAWFSELHKKYELLRMVTVSEDLKILLLQDVYLEFLNQLESSGKIPFCGFWDTEANLYVPENILYQNEESAVIATHFSYDNTERVAIRYRNKISYGIQKIPAPTTKGVHIIQMEIGIKEKGELRWIPVTKRVLVE